MKAGTEETSLSTSNCAEYIGIHCTRVLKAAVLERSKVPRSGMPDGSSGLSQMKAV